MLANFLESADM